MSFEEEFDKIIRRKAEEENYPFDEQNWNKTNSILDAERKVASINKLKRFYLPVAYTVILSSIGFVAYNVFKTENANTPDNVVSHKTILENKMDQPKNSNTENEQMIENSLSSLIIESPERLNNTKPILVAESEIKTQSADLKSNSEKFVESGSAKTKTIPNTSEISNSGQEINLKGAEVTSSKSDLSGLSAEPINSDDPTTSNSKSDVSKDDGEITQARTSTGELSTASINKEQSLSKSKSDVQANFSGIEETTLKIEFLSAVHSFIPLEQNESDLVSTPFTFLKRYDDDYYEKNIKRKIHYFNLEAGAAYLLGWKAKEGSDGQGFNWFAGVNYGRYLTNKTSISFGIQAYSITNIKQPFYQIAQKEYGFGSVSIYTKITTSQLYYIAVPLKFNYHINATNEVGLGLNAAYLISAKSNKSKYYVLDGEEKSIGSDNGNSNSIYEGTNTINLMLTAQYKATLSKRLGLSLELNYGITDIFKNMGDIKTSETPVGIRLGLNYTLFDK
ncbi:hypothetical protein [Aurantibacillus circumpalustris]|uniref:hypothetical protein n=1 Tax=Aurantibacillus circumpalustris TaxID=3036359 RepID=UPI00295C17CB|nr:hypothetical protein [Aurantibacillus circumpalustris]